MRHLLQALFPGKATECDPRLPFPPARDQSRILSILQLEYSRRAFRILARPGPHPDIPLIRVTCSVSSATLNHRFRRHAELLSGWSRWDVALVAEEQMHFIPRDCDAGWIVDQQAVECFRVDPPAALREGAFLTHPPIRG